MSQWRLVVFVQRCHGRTPRSSGPNTVLTAPHKDSLSLISYVPSGEDYGSAVTVIMILCRILEGSSSTWTRMKRKWYDRSSLCLNHPCLFLVRLRITDNSTA